MIQALVAVLAGLLAATAPASKAPRPPVLLATTTSIQDSGLLDALAPTFERATGWRLKVLAVGSGEALALGARGEADVLLVHSPEAEARFMAEGHGSRRRAVMHNDFVLLGPAADPAGVRQSSGIADAMRRLAARRAQFVSRADRSGTHAREQALWKAAGVAPPAGVLETGQGMGETIRVADEKAAYVLADRGTYLALARTLRLVVVREGDAALRNDYHVIEIAPGGHPRLNAAGGRAFADFLVSPAGQAIVRGFGVARWGRPLFVPDAVP